MEKFDKTSTAKELEGGSYFGNLDEDARELIKRLEADEAIWDLIEPAIADQKEREDYLARLLGYWLNENEEDITSWSVNDLRELLNQEEDRALARFQAAALRMRREMPATTNIDSTELFGWIRDKVNE